MQENFSIYSKLDQLLEKNYIFKSRSSFFIAILSILLGAVFLVLEKTGQVERYYMQRYFRPNLVQVKPRQFQSLKFGLVTDAHSVTKNGRIQPDSLLPMQKFVQQMKNFEPEFVIEIGDFIEGSRRTEAEAINDFSTLNSVFSQAGVPVYHVLGNHELRSFNKQRWLELTGHKKTYYYFDVPPYRFIVLDGNFIPNDGRDEDVEPKKDLTRGSFSQAQLVWLEELLKNSNNFRKVVFVHHPPLEKTNERLRSNTFPVRSQTLREILTKYRVKAVFSGHIEEKFKAEIDGVQYYVLPGFNKDEDKQIDGQNYPAYYGVFAQVEVTRQDPKVIIHYQSSENGPYESLEF